MTIKMSRIAKRWMTEPRFKTAYIALEKEFARAKNAIRADAKPKAIPEPNVSRRGKRSAA